MTATTTSGRSDSQAGGGSSRRRVLSGGRIGLLSQMQDFDVDLRRLLLILWRRRLLILGIMAVAMGMMLVFISTIKSRYSARVLVKIETSDFAGSEISPFMAGLRIDSTLILSEVEVIKSRSLGRRVIERLNLLADPEFNPRMIARKDGADQETVSGSENMAEEEEEKEKESSSFKTLSVYKGELASLPPEVVDQETGLVVNRFLDRMIARPITGSSVIQIQFNSTNPQKSALIANTIADIYIEQRLEAKFRATQKLTGWLDKRLKTLREQVRAAEAEVEEYKAEKNLIAGAKAEITAQQLSELNSQLVLATARRAEAYARLEQIKSWEDAPENMESTAEVQASPLIQELKGVEADLLQKRAELSSRYGRKHPAMRNIDAELGAVREKIHEETRKIVRVVESELLTAEARMSALQKSLDEIESQRKDENQAMIRLRELERESISTRTIFDTFLETYKRSDKKEQLEEPEAKIISYATVPLSPSYPNKPLFLSLTSAVALFVGISVALLLEKLDNAYRSATQLEAGTGYPCYGLIPELDTMSATEMSDYVLKKPSSAIAESLRTLRTVITIQSQRSGEKAKVLTIASSLPGEGKTTLSAWMGRIAAKSGEKVIVVDCDLRRSNLHRVLGVENDKTIVEYLTDEMKLEEVINTSDPSGMHVLLARSTPSNALNLIGSDKMKRLVASLRKAYDFVILDTPACLAVSDARILANQADQTLFVVKWNKTPREVVKTGVKQFADFDYDPLACVLSHVDVKRHARYGYGDTAYYYSRYKDYYT